MSVQHLRQAAEYLFPAVLVTFVVLYTAGLLWGVEPELALARAAGVTVLLAIAGRIAQSVLDSPSLDAEPEPEAVEPATTGRLLDVTIDEEASPAAAAPSGAPPTEPRTGASAVPAGGD
jgi:hypothetical protein